MYCRRCGKELSSDSEFCQYCGNAIFDFKVKTETKISEDNAKPNDNHNLKPENNNRKHRIKKIAILFSLTIIIVLLMGLKIRKSPVEKVVAMSNSVFLLNIYNENKDIVATGSGFLAFDDLTLVTNYHVIEGAYAVEVISEDNQIFNVTEVLNYDIEKDIAILKLDKPTKLEVLNLDSSHVVEKGDEIVAVGSPLGLKNTISNGIVSSIINEDDIESIQITAPISSGSSGGPLFNNKGKVIGITFASYEGGQNLNLAIPIGYVITLNDSDSKNVPIEQFNNSLIGRQPYNSDYSHSVTKYLGYIYHNFNSNYQITKVNIKTGEKTSLNIFGKYINVYNDKIYYINKDNSIIYVSDLVGNNARDITSTLLKQDKENAYLCDLLVSKYGVLFADGKDLLMNSDLYALNEDYSLRKKLSGLVDLQNIQYTENSIIIRKDNSLIFYDIKNLDIIGTINIPDDSIISWNYYSDSFVYTKESGGIQKLDLNTGVNSILYPSNLKIFIQGIYKDNIYFFMRNDGAKNFADGSIYKININGDFIKKVYDEMIIDRNFLDDNIYFIPNKKDAPYSKSDLDGNNITVVK